MPQEQSYESLKMSRWKTTLDIKTEHLINRVLLRTKEYQLNNGVTIFNSKLRGILSKRKYLGEKQTI